MLSCDRDEAERRKKTARVGGDNSYHANKRQPQQQREQEQQQQQQQMQQQQHQEDPRQQQQESPSRPIRAENLTEAMLTDKKNKPNVTLPEPWKLFWSNSNKRWYFNETQKNKSIWQWVPPK